MRLLLRVLAAAAVAVTVAGIAPATAAAGQTGRDWRDWAAVTPGDRDSDGIPDPQDRSDASAGPSFDSYVVVRVLSGQIVSHPSGIEDYEPVVGAERLPFGTVIDTRYGLIELTSVKSPGSPVVTQTIQVSLGIVRLEQITGADAYTQLRLRTASSVPPCPDASARVVVSAAGPSPARARLLVDAHGKFQTRGKRSRSRARGTVWLTEEFCDGTQTTVQEGEVVVTDLGTNAEHTITAPGTVTAPGTAPSASTYFASGRGAVADTGDAGVSSCHGGTLRPNRSNRRRVRAATLCLLDARRSEYGLEPLRSNEDLREAAQAHSDIMVRRKFYGHVDPDGAGAATRVQRTHYGGGAKTVYSAESLGYNYARSATPVAIVRQWMVSEEHRLLILTARYRDIGIGITPGLPNRKKRTGATYVTVFGAAVGRRAS